MQTFPMTIATQPMLSLWGRPTDRVAPSAAVVAAVLSFGDVCEADEDGVTLIRFSPGRVLREDIQLLLGSDCQRTLDISVLWNDREMELLDVIDAASGDEPEAESFCGEDYARAKMRDVAL